MAVLNWLVHTSYVEWVNESWGWPLALTIHAFGTATVVGLTFIIGLRLFGLFRTIPYTSMNKLVPFIWFAAACQIISGDFYARAAAAAKTAYRASRAQQDGDFKTYVAELRVACDSCHGLYLKSDQ